MIHKESSFYLKIQKIQQLCLFELSWGKRQQLSVTVSYPEILTTLYQEWQRVYLGFYQTALRGRVEVTGSITPQPIDWHAKLVQAEAKFLYEFHRWLRQESLYEIRRIIAGATKELEEFRTHHPVEVFITCHPLEIERLPWEVWEIGTEFATANCIRLVRTPLNLREKFLSPQKSRFHQKARILVILGDETGLNFQADQDALKVISSVTEIQVIRGKSFLQFEDLKTQLIQAITDPQGWDILLFAGHSKETELTGGEIAIAPGVHLSMNELKLPLKFAIEQGLKFALFNSCNGLSLANTLTELGLAQVAVMREPIHNQVAQEFFWQFLQNFAEYKDVQDSLRAACQYLKLEKNITYPSAYLIPSLFRHPESPVFRLEPKGIKHQLKRWLPTRQEVIILSILLTISWQLPLQNLLLEQRETIQAWYRQITHQIPQKSPTPIVIVQIDEKSIQTEKISDPKPMDRGYLAKIVQKLAQLDTKVIGIDYFLARYQENNDQRFTNSLKQAIEKNKTWFVFAATINNSGVWLEVLPEIADSAWSLQGDARVLGNPILYLTLVPRHSSDRHLSFAYLLALSHQLSTNQIEPTIQPNLKSSDPLISQLKNQLLERTDQDYREFFSSSARLQPLTNFSYRFSQMWLHPVIDYSIPPEQVYQTIPAWKLLSETPDSLDTNLLSQAIIIIAAGGYSEAGITAGEDNFKLPAAIQYWRTQHSPNYNQIFTGGEAHAYMIHHFLTRRFVIPIPDLWLIGLAAFLGKASVLMMLKGNRWRFKNSAPKFRLIQNKKLLWLTLFATGIYGIISLQLYISLAILLPWVFPSITIWLYLSSALSKQKFDE
jgi:CHASE2 domain-containing sensor protein